ncbi:MULTISPECIES: CPBP family intramembrane glutamic endopeptidase [Asaia]|uniref:CPBP family intramembrane glutamic endopeptidase n=1 Tax=Asaia TaxID=91914 RepID=UPI002554E74D|nr:MULTISPECIES: CPBP family intramembrane glutamic endopeptidase [Asaia]MDL2172508.1 CPBP family intramembrane metalloprotease [Asaia sp. HumB]MDR6184070.1 membrane protease YdiL (CAAX protease family) [Asaia bogorensis NBRC 16594]
MARDTERSSEIRPFSLRAAILSTLVCGGLGWIGIVVLQKREFLSVLMGSPPGGSQIAPILAGFLYGGVLGKLAWLMVRQPFLMGVTRRYVALTSAVRGWPAIIVVSLFAGAGEEVLFRSALQYWLGVIGTAFLFVLVHGYFSLREWRLSLYGLFLFLGMIPLGLAASHWGLIGPIVAHAVIDVVLFSAFSAMRQTDTDCQSPVI